MVVLSVSPHCSTYSTTISLTISKEAKSTNPSPTTFLGSSIERTIIYKAPFVKCDREEDYEVAWREFERRNDES
jgi:hypothetical protein